jgi:ADP-ribose pyrophosphatase YjhB (NUDIX family)
MLTIIKNMLSRIFGMKRTARKGYTYPFEMLAASSTVAIFNGNNVLLGLRKGDPYKGQWCVPGGFIEPSQETPEQAAIREVKEETGITIAASDLTRIVVQADVSRDPRERVIDFFFAVRIDSFDTTAMILEKHTGTLSMICPH